MNSNNLILNARKLVEQDLPNYEEAYKLLVQAYEAGEAEAAYAIATWYLHGVYVKQDGVMGTKYLREAVKQNWPDALYDLAVSYESGLYVKKNRKIAFQLYLKSAIRGQKEAMMEVSRCYNFGIGIRKSLDLAQIWYDRAIELGVNVIA